jgi:predicted enzyme related to lactoylglutathione lyase
MSKMNSVVHFEMPYDDRKRMAKFYQDAFGWQTRMLGEEMGNYVIATTTESDESRPKRPGAINGGFFARKPDWPGQHPSVVIAVDDIQAAMKKVAKAGGKVLGEPMEIPGIGQYVAFVDTEEATAHSARLMYAPDVAALAHCCAALAPSPPRAARAALRATLHVSRSCVSSSFFSPLGVLRHHNMSPGRTSTAT